jgi:acyl-CoA reductase-like NAD-dependent aldehyde dehydrogenase
VTCLIEDPCTCGVEPDANVATADDLREAARRILEAGTDDWRPGKVNDRNFLDAAVGYLNEHSAHIAEILTDQWSLVKVVRRRYNIDTHEFETLLLLRIQCDRVEDGVARAVQILAERSGRP